VTTKVPAELEDALYAAVGAIASAQLARAVVDRSKRYTSERDRLGDTPAGDLAARALFFTVCDAMKIAIPLGELAARGVLPTARPLRIVDLGAGCGAMTLGAMATVGLALHVTAIDRDAAALAIARKAITTFARSRAVSCELVTQTADVASAPIPRADLVVIGSVLNELAPAGRLAVVERALAAIVDDGAVIIIEPALRDTARPLHELRDAIITRGSGHVFAPCTRRGTPCTALVDERDWCHEDRPLVLPPRTAELARRTHLRDSGMKFAYLVLRREPRSLADDPDAWRIVSAPMPAKGKLELIGCGERGRVTLRLLKRHRSDANRPIERADRGDIVTAGAPVDEDRVELVNDTVVSRFTT